MRDTPQLVIKSSDIVFKTVVDMQIRAWVNRGKLPHGTPLLWVVVEKDRDKMRIWVSLKGGKFPIIHRHLQAYQ